MAIVDLNKACETNEITNYLNKKIGDGGDGGGLGVSKQYVDDQDTIEREARIAEDTSINARLTDFITEAELTGKLDTDYITSDEYPDALKKDGSVKVKEILTLTINKIDVDIKTLKQAVADIGGGDLSNYALKTDLDTATTFKAMNPTLTTPAPEVLDKVVADINTKVDAIGGGGNSLQKRVMVTAYDDPNTTIDKNNIYLDEIVIKGTSGANGIKILCAKMTKAEFEGALGVGVFGKIVKVTLEDTIIKSIPKLITASSIATHSLVNAFNDTASVGEVRISCQIGMVSQTRVDFAKCFVSQYDIWRSKFGLGIPLRDDFLWNAQLVFEGEYLEIEWRDWEDLGSFEPRIKKPLWYEGVFPKSGSPLIYGTPDTIRTYFDPFISVLSGGIYGTCYAGSYVAVTNATVTSCLDLGDILAEGHPLKYRLAMLVPSQLAPTCIDMTTSSAVKADFRNDALSIQAKVSNVITSISPNIYANESYLMFDNISGTYMVIPMGNKTFKGYSYDKCARGSNDNTIEIGEHNAVLKHSHNFTGNEAAIANTGSNSFSGGSTASAMYAAPPLYKPTGTIGLPTDASISEENRVDSLYVYQYLRF